MRLQHHIDALIVLDAIDRRGSFAAAADELHRATSSITYAVQQLETAIDVSLFDRNGHRSKLTAAGQELLREGRLLLNSINHIEQNVQIVASGWEPELRIAINDIINQDLILDLIEEFYQSAPESTRIRIAAETFMGPWDALISGRADFAIGVPGDITSPGNFRLQLLGELKFVFVVAATHPLAEEPEPISSDTLRHYRAVAAADSSRVLQPKTFGLLPGQRVLTVPNQSMKQKAICNGLGVGHLPLHMIKNDLQKGYLLSKSLENETTSVQKMQYAWPTVHKGKALAWFQQRFGDSNHTINWFSPD